MINKKKIEHNKEIKQFVFDMITLYESKNYGQYNPDTTKRLYDILERGGHFTDKTTGVFFYLSRQSKLSNRWELTIFEKQGWSNYSHSVNIEFDELREQLRGN